MFKQRFMQEYEREINYIAKMSGINFGLGFVRIFNPSKPTIYGK